MPTTYLFIDGGHLRRNYSDSVRPWFGSEGEIDFRQIKDGFLGGGIARCFYYDALEDEQRDGESTEDFAARVAQEEAIFNKIEELDGYFVGLGSVTGQRRNRRQKKVDILLAVQALDHAVRRNMDRAILLTGDRDFEPLVQSLVQSGIHVHVAGDKKHTSAYLRRAADNFTPLSFDQYFEMTAAPLREKFPVAVNKTAMPPDDAELVQIGLCINKKKVLALHGRNNMYYIRGEDLLGNSITVRMKDFLDRLKLYFELQYRKVEWKN